MAIVGDIIIGMSARTDQLARDLSAASTNLDAFGGQALQAASAVDAVGAKAEQIANQVQAASSALGKFEGATGAAVSTVKSLGPAMMVVSAQIKEFAVVTRSASLVAGTLAAAVRILSKVLYTIATPFIAAGRFAAYVAKNFGILGIVFGVALAPLRPFIPLLRMFNAVAGASIGVVKGLGWSFGALRAVLNLNVKALALNVAKLGMLGAAMAVTAATKAATFAFNAVKMSLSAMTKVAIPAALAFTYIAGSAAAAVDKTGDTADRLGTSTANLMAMQYAAKLTGSNVESLNGALAKMVPNLGDAAIKGGPAADALKSVGLSAQDLARMDAVDAFALIADRLSQVENPAQRAAMTMDIFGKSGAAILGTINAGGTEIQRLTEEFRSFGAVSETQRQSIGKMFDAFDKIGTVIGAVGAAFAAELSPYISAVAEQIVGLATSSGGAGIAVTTAVDAITSGIAYALDAVTMLNHGFLLAQQFATQAFASIVGGAAFVSSYLDALRGPVAAVASAIAYVGDVAWTAGAMIGDAFGAVARSIGGIASWLIGKAMQLVEVFGQLYTAIAGETQKSNLTASLESMKKGLEESAAAQAGDIKKFAGKSTLGDQARSVFAEIKRGAADAATMIDPATAAMKRMGDATFEVGGKIGGLPSPQAAPDSAALAKILAENEAKALALRDLPAVRADLQRITALWSGLLAEHGGPMLWGDFCIADAYFAPVVMRLKTYALPVPAQVQAYMDRVCALPGVKAWVDGALAEKDFIDFEKPFRLRP